MSHHRHPCRIVGRIAPLAALLTFLTTGAVSAAVPVVVTDIAPVQSLVARVMDGLGEPAVLLPPGASPHDYTLRPSQATALAHAELVFRIGPTLSPALEGPLAALTTKADVVTLLDTPGTVLLPFREGAGFEAHHHHDHTGHDADHDDHDHAHDGQDEIDPHAWLDPENGRAWLDAIAQALSRADPEHAAAYAANAAAGQDEIAALEPQIAARLAQITPAPFLLLHDSTQYFEARFGLQAAAAISLADGAVPGPARLLQIRDRITESDARCALAEPQSDTRLIRTAAGTHALKIVAMDPLGAELTPGPAFYAELLHGLAISFADCLS